MIRKAQKGWEQRSFRVRGYLSHGMNALINETPNHYKRRFKGKFRELLSGRGFGYYCQMDADGEKGSPRILKGKIRLVDKGPSLETAATSKRKKKTVEDSERKQTARKRFGEGTSSI